MPQHLAERLHFMHAFVTHPRLVGAVLPTSRRAVRDMLDQADVAGARLVVELGAGTGVYTSEILARLHPDGRVLALEIDPRLAKLLAERFQDPRLQVTCDSAENLLARLDGATADVLVSGLPFTSLSADVRRRILGQMPRALAPRGVALVLQYSPMMQSELRRLFPSVRRQLSPLNVPPAFLFTCSTEGSAGSPEAGVPLLTQRSWREGRRYVLAAGALGTALLVGRRRSGWFAMGAAGLAAAFFRDPERSLDADPGVVYAAADGVVKAIDASVHDPWMPAERAVRITTFLGLHNVHVNRSPVMGEVTRMDAVRGGFAPALFSRAGDNTRKRLAIDGPSGRVVVVQVAGMIARTIKSWVARGDRVAAGQRIGMIHFGSRTDVLLPVGSAEVLVRPGTRVRAGITPLARYRAEA